MKKAVLAVGCGCGVLAGMALLWKVVFPFLGILLQKLPLMSNLR